MKNTLITLLICSTALTANAASVELPSVVVTAKGEKSLTVPDNATATKEIKKTAGGVAVIDAKVFEDKFSVSFEDTLSLTAGVYAQKRFGEEVRISIRGSGLSRGFHMRGLQLLQDGIPFNLADGAGERAAVHKGM